MKKTGAVHVALTREMFVSNGFLSALHAEGANTEDVCQLPNGVTILLQGKKEKMKGGM